MILPFPNTAETEEIPRLTHRSIFISPPQSIGANMVGEMFFQHEKGAKLGIWTLLTSLGPPVGECGLAI